MTDIQKIQELLDQQQYMVLAVTLDDSTPWAVPVKVQAWDGGKVFEWESALTTEHSKALVKNPDMAITIFQKSDAGQVGLYMKGRGELVEEFKPGFGRYRFTAKQSWLNDETFQKREVEL